MASSGQSEACATWIPHDHFERVERGGVRVAEVLRDYTGVDRAEFFAVASEAFFERPDALRAKLPALYRNLQRFYGPEHVEAST